MLEKNEMIFGVRAVIEAIQAGREVDKVLVCQLRTSEHRSMYSYVRLSIDRCTATYV